MSFALTQLAASGLVPGLPRIGARRAPAFNPLSLFAGTSGGFWNDMTVADVLTASATGAAAIAAAGDRIGLAFDKSRWEGLLRDAIWAAQPELIRNGGFASDTEWTKDANETMAPIHNRMPVILGKFDLDAWLSGRGGEDLLKPCPAEWIEARKVSTYVNSVKNQGEKCIEPLE
ncbi:SOS response-associated peptidase family protein [Parvibaculum sp.]|uniref:SOS response-associated peptidase family protein n=1 Tax=Parvibaculum sp. TaxID=2024848 RepID=UPI003918B8F6